MGDDWRESALGGGVVLAFMMTLCALPIALALVIGLPGAVILSAGMVAVLGFIDRNGSGLRGQVLLPGRAAIFGGVALSVAAKIFLT